MNISAIKNTLKPYDKEIKQLAKKIKKHLDKKDQENEEDIVAIIYLIIAMNIEQISTPFDVKTLLINVLTKQDNHVLNRLYKIKHMPETIIIKQPIMTVEDYFTMIWDQLYQIHNTDAEGSKQKYTLTWS
tara:strand:- start:440 stop:829 length:390 start_codon:yes stop_codon:yes gene_type:complete